MASRCFICNVTAERYYDDMIVKENQRKEQILYKPLYENLLLQTNKYITDM